MNTTRISVIIPVYNGERFLAEAIRSVLDQTLPPDEIIVVDDGSTDDSADIVAGMPLPPKTELTLVRQPNQGPAAARNRGIALAAGELIAFLDADDLWMPEKLERQIAHLAQEPAADGVICHVESFVEPGGKWPPGRNRTLFDQLPPMYSFCTLLIRRPALDRVGRLDPQYRAGEDTEWFARASDAGLIFAITPAALLRRRFHSANLSHSNAAATPRQLVHIVRDSLHRRRHEG
jgi:glycosyltransferase involved in cell wall biosynthesis